MRKNCDATKWVVLAAGPMTLVLVLILPLGGCGSAAANTAAALLGGGALAGAATHSSAEVKVELYDPRGDTDGRDFEFDQMLAVRKTILETAATRLLDIEAAAAPHVSEIQAQTTVLRRLAAEDRADEGPSVRKGGAQLSDLADRETQMDAAWQRFEKATEVLAESTSAAHVQAASQALRGFRSSLGRLSARPLGDEAFTEVKFLLLGDVKLATVPPTDRGTALAAYDRHVGHLASAGTGPATGLADRLDDLFGAARREFAASAPALAAIAKDERVFLQPLKAAQVVQGEAMLTITITNDAITTSVSLGPVSNEVTQIVLTPGKLLGRIADPANKGKWRPISPNAVCSGPGNSDVIFYMENQATPVLKSATFDPTKFIVAAGAVYERAFSVLADAAGGGGAAAGTAPATSDGGGSSGKKKASGAAAGNAGNAGGGSSPGSPKAAGATAAATATSDDPKTVKALQKRIAAIKAVEVTTLEDVLKAQEGIKAAGTDQTKVKAAIIHAKSSLGADVQKLRKGGNP